MFDVNLHGPIEILPPMQVSRAELVITGITCSDPASTTYVILDEVSTGMNSPPDGHEQFIGTIQKQDLTDAQVVLDITAALNRALSRRPNFYISFVTEKTGTTSSPSHAFQFSHLEITHEHAVQFDYGLSADVVHH